MSLQIHQLYNERTRRGTSVSLTTRVATIHYSLIYNSFFSFFLGLEHQLRYPGLKSPFVTEMFLDNNKTKFYHYFRGKHTLKRIQQEEMAFLQGHTCNTHACAISLGSIFSKGNRCVKSQSLRQTWVEPQRVYE